MAHQYLLQPDGQLAVFDTITDEIIIADASPAELEEWVAEKAAKAARKDTRRILHEVLDLGAERVYHRFTMSYEDAAALHLRRGGDPRMVCRPKAKRKRGRSWKRKKAKMRRAKR